MYFWWWFAFLVPSRARSNAQLGSCRRWSNSQCNFSCRFLARWCRNVECCCPNWPFDPSDIPHNYLGKKMIDYSHILEVNRFDRKMQREMHSFLMSQKVYGNRNWRKMHTKANVLSIGRSRCCRTHSFSLSLTHSNFRLFSDLECNEGIAHQRRMVLLVLGYRSRRRKRR